MTDVERWHLDLAARGLTAGCLITVISLFSRRSAPPAIAALAITLPLLVRFASLDLAHPVLLLTISVGLLPALSRSKQDPSRLGSSRWAAAILGGAAVGIWATEPDTEGPLLVGTVLGPLLAALLVRRIVIDRTTTGLATIALVAGATAGAAGRPQAVAGAVCCLWLIAWALLPERLGGFRAAALPPSRGPRTVILVIVQAISVAIGSRVVASVDGATTAWWVTLSTVGGGLLVVSARRSPSR